MLMSASAGIMEGDRQEFTFDIKSGAHLEFISQSYDKVHQMNGGCAKRVTHIKVAENGTFFYDPQPMIPFKDSAFESKMKVELKDKTSRFWLSEIFSCGRYARGEMTIHGFRSMASTLLNEQGYNRDWIERQLAHCEKNAVRAAYNHAEYLPERRRMMQEWADYLDGLKARA